MNKADLQRIWGRVHTARAKATQWKLETGNGGLYAFAVNAHLEDVQQMLEAAINGKPLPTDEELFDRRSPRG